MDPLYLQTGSPKEPFRTTLHILAEECLDLFPSQLHLWHVPPPEPAVDERVEDEHDDEREEEVEGGRDERVAHPVRQRVRLRRVPVRVLPGQRLKAAGAASFLKVATFRSCPEALLVRHECPPAGWRG